MLWEIMRLLPEMLEQPEFRPLKNYLADAADVRKRFQLSSQIANLFDQYLVFRPDLILAWDQGRGSLRGLRGPNDHEAWQAALWRRLRQGKPAPHLATPLEGVRRARRPSPISSRRRCRSGFPSSASRPCRRPILQMFRVLGAFVEVHLFLLQPSKEYWGLIVNARESERILKAAKKGDAAAPELHLEAGNHLLASTGQSGPRLPQPGPGSGRLGRGQRRSRTRRRAICCRTSRRTSFTCGTGGGKIVPGFRSARPTLPLRVHSCHSPLREVEVLYDHLLEWFERDPTLTPRDVLVMTPDIEAYAPFIQAVFDSPEEASKRIPFSVADRGIRSASQVIDAFFNLLSLPATRLEATSVLRLLEADTVREKFGVSESDLDTIRVWVRKTNIRWGQDAKQRESLGLPGLSENTWQQGMDRLLLGYAMAGKGEQHVQRCAALR